MSTSPLSPEEPRSDLPSVTIDVSWNTAGIEFRLNLQAADRRAQSRDDCDLALYLRQLEDEGYVLRQENRITLEWLSYYRLASSPDHQESTRLLMTPPVEPWRPILASKGTLTDPDFSISIVGWLDGAGRKPNGNVDINGAVITAGRRSSIMPEGVWLLLGAVGELRDTPSQFRVADTNRGAWAKIRSYATSVGADMSDFLRRTVVLTPDRLRIDMRKCETPGGKVVEIVPGFEGAPSRWLEIFDRMREVPSRYEVPDGNGIVHVLLTPEVRTVLREVRRMPGRRVAGARAEAFIRNPFATLGPDATAVIDVDQFEKARDAAGISFPKFTVLVWRDDRGRACECALLVQETLDGVLRAEELRFQGAEDIELFLAKLDRSLNANAQCCHWRGFDLEILGDTPYQAQILREALEQLREPTRLSLSEILDLSNYSERIRDFGVEKPYYSPFIARKRDDSGWFPENVDVGLSYTQDDGETVAITFDGDALREIDQQLENALRENRETFVFPGCPRPVSVAWAQETVRRLGQARREVSAGTFSTSRQESGRHPIDRRGLVVKPNVNTLDYEERRGLLAGPPDLPKLPASLKSNVKLLDHQLHGIAWLQHLWRMSPFNCRGALLADDMGLGKTIQLLTFIAAAIENEPQVDPFLVVAPVSLLENWKEEISKFFLPGALEVLTLYGATLAEKRIPKAELDEELLGAGVTRLLVPGWLGSAQIVLTTYETMRDLEFSLARQRWAAMICDEAQKIKNPNAMVTRSAKKQNARLKIACTGTPVENSLTDIWCLFDFIQPGLLGPLQDFGARYRRPIEAKSDEEKQRLSELRELIGPQTLRRLKSEVARDLPKKIEVESCRSLPISDLQRLYYAEAIRGFRQPRKGEPSGLQSPLGLLQYLRRLCSDPRPMGNAAVDSEAVDDIELHSPKMLWLTGQLREIARLEEKAIVFCEFRDLQRTIQRVVSERFGFVPDVINGSTTTELTSMSSRLRRIGAFQQKPGFGVLVLSPLAVGFGVNIQAANHVIHFTRSWNPAREDQATDRSYRIGQDKDVSVYYPVVVARDFVTFDAQLDRLLEWKRSLSSDMLNGSADLGPSDFEGLGAPDGGSAFGDEVITVADLPRLDSSAFEALCALLWSKQGFSQTMLTPRSGDGGVDVVAICKDRGVLIQCKSSTVQGRDLGWEAIKDVAAGAPAYAAHHPGVTFSLVAATNQRFNSSARQQAALLHVELFECDDLGSLLEEFPVRRRELVRFLAAV